MQFQVSRKIFVTAAKAPTCLKGKWADEMSSTGDETGGKLRRSEAKSVNYVLGSFGFIQGEACSQPR